MSIYAGALFIQLALGWDMYLAIVTLLAITGLFTVLGKVFMLSRPYWTYLFVGFTWIMLDNDWLCQTLSTANRQLQYLNGE